MKRLVFLLTFAAVCLFSRLAFAVYPLGSAAAAFPVNCSKVVADPQRNRVYAAVPATNSVIAIDTTTLQVLATIPVGSDPVDMAISRDDLTLYVANHGSTLLAVSVIDLKTLAFKTSYPLPGSPVAIAAGLNGRVYTSVTSDGFESTIEQFDGATGTITGTFNRNYYDNNLFQITPDGKTLFVASTGIEPGSLKRFDVSSATPPTAPLQTNGNASENDSQLVISHNGVYLCLPSGGGNPGAGNYSTFLFSTADITAHYGSFANGAYPGPLAFSPDDTLVYQTRYGGGSLLDVFSTQTFFATEEITLPNVGQQGYPNDISSIVTDKTGSYLFVAESSFNNGDTIGQLAVITTGRGTLTPPSILPVITSSLSVEGTQHTPFTYQIAASNTPTSFNAINLPDGLTVNPATGLISGTPTTAGYFYVTISAINASGSATATLELYIDYNSQVPYISTTFLPEGNLGTAYSATITATNSPYSYSATGLPAGLSINTASGLISGVPTKLGTAFVEVEATNSYGTGTANFYLSINVAAPIITSASTASGTVGTPFTYQITATNSPGSYAASGLPDGLSFDPDQGLISGTPTTAGTYTVLVSAYNPGNTSTLELTLTVAPLPVPVITSASAAAVTAGQPFTYQITASNDATSYGVLGLLDGLNLDAATGLISGTPTTVGVFVLTLDAVNTTGTGTGTLTLAVNPVLPTVAVMTTVPRVTAGSGEDGEIIISRTGDLSQKLVVHYTLGGSAQNGVDYQTLSGKAKLKPNKASATILIVPKGTLAGKTTKKVKLTLVPSANFQIGGVPKAKVKIILGE